MASKLHYIFPFKIELDGLENNSNININQIAQIGNSHLYLKLIK